MWLPLAGMVLLFLTFVLVVVAVLFSLKRSGISLDQVMGSGPVNFLGFERDAIDINGRKVLLSYSPRSKKHPSRMMVSFKGDFFAHAVFRREQATDRFGKSTGINAEIQLNDERFDSMVYVECEDELFIRRLFDDAQTRVHLENILNAADSFTINGNSCGMTKSPCEEPAYLRSDVVRQAAASMVALADHIPAPGVGERSSTPLTDKSVRDTGLLTALAALVLLSGFFLIVWGLASFDPLFPGRLFQVVLPVMVPAAGILVFFFVAAFKGRSTGFNSLVLALILGVAGVALASFGGAVVFNGSQDISRQEFHKVAVISKYTTSRKGRTRYHVRVSSWRDDLSSYSFDVSEWQYKKLAVGSRCEVLTRSGALGVPWVEGHGCDVR